MKEASYSSILADKIEKEIGGQVIKWSDRSGLGRPDNIWLVDKMVIFYETKISDAVDYVSPQEDSAGIGYWRCQPGEAIKDIRQYEVCRAMAKNANLVYIIYYPAICMTAIMSMEMTSLFVETGNSPATCKYLRESDSFERGHGIRKLQSILNSRKQEMYAKLDREYGEGVSAEVRSFRGVVPDNGHS